MDENKKRPYAIRMTLALMAQNRELKRKIMAECLEEMTEKLVNVAREYDVLDLPFVIAAMKTVSTALWSALDDEGRKLADNLVKSTSCVMINEEELRKQAQELDQEEK